MKKLLIVLLVLAAQTSNAQKVDSIYFNLYTDSLKKGVHNYINVVAKMSNGSHYPLMADELIFSSSAGKWQGNSLIIDSSYGYDSVMISARLKNGQSTQKSTVIYLKKNTYEPPLKTEEELLNDWRKKGKKQLSGS